MNESHEADGVARSIRRARFPVLNRFFAMTPARKLHALKKGWLNYVRIRRRGREIWENPPDDAPRMLGKLPDGRSAGGAIELSHSPKNCGRPDIEPGNEPASVKIHHRDELFVVCASQGVSGRPGVRPEV